MIITISSQNNSLESAPSLRFGRAPYFIKYNLSDDTWEALQNAAVNERGGAGIAASQFIIDNESNAALSGHFGPNAARVLSQAGIKMISFDETYQTVQSVIDAYKENLLNEVSF